ncbi:MAG: hypothetical protein ACLQDY_08295 [Streptosporangiaceae bacterium]
MTEDRDLRHELAMLGAHSKWAKETDRSAATQKARDAFLRTFEPDPEIVPDPVQRREMAEHALAAHMARMRLARRRKATAEAQGPSADSALPA